MSTPFFSIYATSEEFCWIFFFLSCTESSVLWTRKPLSEAFAVGENWDQRGDLLWVLWHDRWGHVLKRRKVGGRGNPSRLYRKKNYPPFSTSNNMGRRKSTKMLVRVSLVVPTQTQPWARPVGQPGYSVLTYQQSCNVSSTDTDGVGNSYMSADFLAWAEGVCGKRRLLWTSYLSTGGLPFGLKDFSKKSLPSEKVNVLWCSYLCCEGLFQRLWGWQGMFC